MIAHVAITVSSAENAKEFFVDVMKCKYLYGYGLDSTASLSLFGIADPTHAYIYLSKEDWIEVFVLKGYRKTVKNFEHICFRVDDVPGVVARGQKLGYEFIRHRSSNKTVLFVKDKDGNLYELKKSAPETESNNP